MGTAKSNLFKSFKMKPEAKLTSVEMGKLWGTFYGEQHGQMYFNVLSSPC